MNGFKRVVPVAAVLCLVAAAGFGYYGVCVRNHSPGCTTEEHIAKTTEEVACLEKQLKEVEKKMSHMYQALSQPADSKMQGELSKKELEQELMVLTEKISGLLEDHQQVLASVGSSNKKSMYQKFKTTLENAFVSEQT